MKQAVNILLVLALLSFLVGTVARFLSDGVFLGNEAVVYWRGAMGFLALSNVLSLYNLAIDKKKFIFLPAIFFGLEVLILSLFHNSLTEYLRMLILVNVLLFIFLLVTSVNSKEFLAKSKEKIRLKFKFQKI